MLVGISKLTIIYNHSEKCVVRDVAQLYIKMHTCATDNSNYLNLEFTYDKYYLIVLSLRFTTHEYCITSILSTKLFVRK